MVIIAKLNGMPRRSDAGDVKSSFAKPPKSLKVFVNSAMRKQPMRSVLRQVRPNNARFTQGNFCCGASSNNISADGLNELSMKPVLLGRLLERLQVLAWLETHGLSGRDIHFRS